MTLPTSTIIQSHWGRPSGVGQLMPCFFNFFVISPAVAFAWRPDLQVAITKASANEALFLISIILISSALASSKKTSIFLAKLID
mgnify:CR=1 FL=1